MVEVWFGGPGALLFFCGHWVVVSVLCLKRITWPVCDVYYVFLFVSVWACVSVLTCVSVCVCVWTDGESLSVQQVTQLDRDTVLIALESEFILISSFPVGAQQEEASPSLLLLVTSSVVASHKPTPSLGCF